MAQGLLLCRTGPAAELLWAWALWLLGGARDPWLCSWCGGSALLAWLLPMKGAVSEHGGVAYRGPA